MDMKAIIAANDNGIMGIDVSTSYKVKDGDREVYTMSCAHPAIQIDDNLCTEWALQIAPIERIMYFTDSSESHLPWKSKQDMKFFAETTKNSTVIMGAKTFRSTGPLRDRLNVVLINTDYPEDDIRNLWLKHGTVKEILRGINLWNIDYCVPSKLRGGSRFYSGELERVVKELNVEISWIPTQVIGRTPASSLRAYIDGVGKNENTFYRTLLAARHPILSLFPSLTTTNCLLFKNKLEEEIEKIIEKWGDRHIMLIPKKRKDDVNSKHKYKHGRRGELMKEVKTVGSKLGMKDVYCIGGMETLRYFGNSIKEVFLTQIKGDCKSRIEEVYGDPAVIEEENKNTKKIEDYKSPPPEPGFIETKSEELPDNRAALHSIIYPKELLVYHHCRLSLLLDFSSPFYPGDTYHVLSTYSNKNREYPCYYITEKGTISDSLAIQLVKTHTDYTLNFDKFLKDKFRHSIYKTFEKDETSKDDPAYCVHHYEVKK